MESRKKTRKRRKKPFRIHLLRSGRFPIQKKLKFLAAIRRGQIIYAPKIKMDGTIHEVLPHKPQWKIVPANVADEIKASDLKNLTLTKWRKSNGDRSPSSLSNVVLWGDWFFKDRFNNRGQDVTTKLNTGGVLLNVEKKVKSPNEKEFEAIAASLRGKLMLVKRELERVSNTLQSTKDQFTIDQLWVKKKQLMKDVREAGENYKNHIELKDKYLEAGKAQYVLFDSGGTTKKKLKGRITKKFKHGGEIQETGNDSYKTLLSLFDESGEWSKPFYDAGWNVINWDIKISEFMDINLIEDAETALELFENVDGIIAAPPCTDFACSGNQYWKFKDEDGRTRKSLDLVDQVLRLVDLFRPTDPTYDGIFFWAIENPVGRMGRLVGLDNPYYFNPWEFAGWNHVSPKDKLRLNRIRDKNGYDVTNEENEFVLKIGAYTKKTGLWGEFNRNMEKKPILPVKTSPQGSPLQRLGGKSAKTKELRSKTPSGFSKAFYEANKDYRAHVVANEMDEAREFLRGLEFSDGGRVAESTLQAPNGKISNLSPEQWHLVRTPLFKAWFGFWNLIPEGKSNNYYTGNTKKICHLLKEEDPAAILVATDFLSDQVSKNDVLIPMPSRSGCPTDAKELAGQIADKTGAIVFDCLVGNDRESVYEAKKQNKNPRKIDFGFHLTAPLPKADRYFMVDNVIGTGITMSQALNAVGNNAEPLVYAIDPGHISKVVDDNGEPLVVYHGTNKEFNVFDEKFNNYIGFYFTAYQDYSYIKKYTKKTIPAFLNMKNPKVAILKMGLGRQWVEHEGKFLALSFLQLTRDEKNEIIKLGFDGMIGHIKDTDGVFMAKNKTENLVRNNTYELQNAELVIFNPNQIKLADGSNTEFDPENPDIRFADGGAIVSKQTYVSLAMQNLSKISRTVHGDLDTSSVKGKSKIFTLDAESSGKKKTENFKSTIEWLYDLKDKKFSFATEYIKFIKDINLKINDGITKPGTLFRTDNSDKFPYTDVKLIKENLKRFTEYFFKKIKFLDKNQKDAPKDIWDAELIDLIASIHWKINFIDHFFADGVGATAEALADFVFMRYGLPIMKMPDRETWFEMAPKLGEWGNHERKLKFYEFIKTRIAESHELKMEEGGLFHGSPYKFDKFSSERIGTGEGYGAFGWGLYFTSVEDIAKKYAESAIDRAFEYKESFDHNGFTYYVERVFDGLASFKEDLSIENPGDRFINRKRISDNEYRKALSEAKGYSQNLYKISIHEKEGTADLLWLLWDQPISDEVKEKINRQAELENLSFEFRPDGMFVSYTFSNRGALISTENGKEFYGQLSVLLESKKEASLFLLRSGIDGIKYPAESLAGGKTDQTARGFNYVVFDEEAVKIEDAEEFKKGGIVKSELTETSPNPLEIDKMIGNIQKKYLDAPAKILNKRGDKQRADLLKWILDPVNDVKIVIAFSGGKDSVAMVLHCLDIGIPKERIELWHHDVDGGGEQLFDWPCTPSYCRAFADAMGIPILFSYSKGGIVREIYRQDETIQPVYFQKEMDGPFHELLPTDRPEFHSTRMKFPAVSADLSVRWCSWIAKIGVMNKAINNSEKYKNANVVIMTGERRAESTARSKYKEIEPYRSMTKTRRAITWRLILDWSDERVWKTMERHGIQCHPCYELGWSRCSCQICIFSSKNTWASIFEISPEKVARIDEIGSEIGHTLYADNKNPVTVMQHMVEKGSSFIPQEAKERWIDEALGEFKSPIFVVENWKLPAGALNSESSGAV